MGKQGRPSVAMAHGIRSHLKLLKRSFLFLISVSVLRLAISQCSADECGPSVGNPLVMNRVVSRLNHGESVFDINLPSSPPYGIECRLGNPSGSYKLVFTFSNTLASVASASVAIGAATVNSSSSGIDSSDSHIYTLVLTKVADLQQLVVMLEGVTDTSGNKISVS